jgi:hypothetical protein
MDRFMVVSFVGERFLTVYQPSGGIENVTEVNFVKLRRCGAFRDGGGKTALRNRRSVDEGPMGGDLRKRRRGFKPRLLNALTIN